MEEFTTRPELRGTFGMVASTHWLASAAGMAALERGGNAFDAAVTAGFVLQVVEPHLNGPAGEVPILFAGPGQAPTVVCGQGPTPQTATIDRFRELGLDMVPGTGLLAACVPGAFDAWLTLLRDHGTMPLEEVLAPAIGYARDGFPAVAKLRQVVATMEQTFTEHWPTSAATYLPVPSPTGLMRLPGVASTYDRILTEARRSAGSGASREEVVDAARRTWSQGFVAEAIVAACQVPVRDSSGRAHAGLLTHEDLAGYTAGYEPPVSVDRHGVMVHKPGPWSQGPVLLQQLRLLDALDADVSRLDTVEGVHAVVEAAKLAFADREAWYGDPRHVDVPLETLLSEGYAAERARLVGDRASTELRPGSPAGRTPYVTEVMIASGDAPAGGIPTSVGEPTVARSGVTKGDTCHVDVVDRWGNVVSATPSGGWLQSSPVVPELGFPLGTRAQMCWLDPRSASALVPGARPRTTLSATLVTRGDEPVMSLGTPGGDQQDQWTLQLLLRAVDGGMDLQQAIDAPAFHTTSFPGSFWPREMRPGELVVEDRLGAEVIAGLRSRAHAVVESAPWSLGRLSAVARDPETGVLRAGANPRGMQGYAVGR
jgi:gamma-glutamyltranspeptidase/glutathione hydrolase